MNLEPDTKSAYTASGPGGPWYRLFTPRTGLQLGLCLAFLAALFVFDHWLASKAGFSLGSYNLAMLKHVEAQPDASVAILGQSTIGQWLGDGTLARLLEVPGQAVLDAHVGGCDYICSYAETLRLLGDNRHYRRVFFGANLYQMCEDERSWRVFTPLDLAPRDGIPELLDLWLHAKHPLAYYGRALMMWGSDALDDTLASRNQLRDLVRLPTPVNAGKAASWARPKAGASDWSPNCDYAPEEVALKVEAVKRLLRSLTRLADEVYYVVLPDRTRGDPAFARAWEEFISQQRTLASEVPHVHFVDVATEGASRPDQFRDGAHLNGRGKQVQTRLLEEKLRVEGLP